MDAGFYSLSSKRLPGRLSLEVHHGMDFEVPTSQANYNFLDYNFTHEEGATALARIYLDELAMPADIRTDIEITPSFEPYDREKLPKDFISSILLTMTALGWSVVYEDYEDEKIKLESLFGEDLRESQLSDWIKQMDGMKV